MSECASPPLSRGEECIFPRWTSQGPCWKTRASRKNVPRPTPRLLTLDFLPECLAGFPFLRLWPHVSCPGLLP